MIRAVLTDIEGTTSALSFVKDVLFPYSRERLPGFVKARAGDPDIKAVLGEVESVAGSTLDCDGAAALLVQWIDEDRKAGPLKALQGMIWEEGYRNGDFFGHVYEDAARKLREWQVAGVKLFVFSSGSVQAQKLLFAHTEYGDLTPLFSGYFDTRTGSKQDMESYREIARQANMEPGDILFLSDIDGELNAAASAGMATCRLIRDGQSAEPENHPIARTFDDVIIPQ
jgi:enolase-phosphatase E1